MATQSRSMVCFMPSTVARPGAIHATARCGPTVTAVAFRSSVLLPLWTYVRSSSSATASTNASCPSFEMTDMSTGASEPITLIVGNPPFDPGM